MNKQEIETKLTAMGLHFGGETFAGHVYADQDVTVIIEYYNDIMMKFTVTCAVSNVMCTTTDYDVLLNEIQSARQDMALEYPQPPDTVFVVLEDGVPITASKHEEVADGVCNLWRELSNKTYTVKEVNLI